MKYAKSALRPGKYGPGNAITNEQAVVQSSSSISSQNDDTFLVATNEKRRVMSLIEEEGSNFSQGGFSNDSSKPRSRPTSPLEVLNFFSKDAFSNQLHNIDNETSSSPHNEQNGRFAVNFADDTFTRKVVSPTPNSLQAQQRQEQPEHHKPKTVYGPSTGFGKFGPIEFRSDRTSMILKKWSKGCWLHVFPATINMYESMEDMEQWKELHEASLSTGIALDAKTKKFLNKFVKMSINFDTTGDLQKKVKKMEEKKKKANGGDGSVGSGSLSLKQKKVADSSALLPITYVMEEVRSKYYKKNQPLMHTCKISYLGLGGRSIAASFGSTTPEELKRLRAVVRGITRLTKKATKKRGGGKKVRMPGDAESTLTGMLKNQHISSAKSEVSALSNTVYGRNTITAKTRLRS